MVKYKIEQKNGQLKVKAKFLFDENISQSEYDLFSQKFIYGFLKPKLVKKNTLIFTGPESVSLTEKLAYPIEIQDLLFIIDQIVEAVRRMLKEGFLQSKLLFDTDYVFFNERTKGLWMICMPLQKPVSNITIRDFVLSILHKAIIKPNETETYRQLLNNVFNMKPYDIDYLESIVISIDKSVIQNIKKHYTSSSGFITNKQRDYYDHYHNKQESPDEVRQEDDSTGLLLEDDDSTGLLLEDDDSTGLLLEDDDSTGLLLEDDDGTGLLLEDDENTDLLDESKLNGKVNTYKKTNGFMSGPYVTKGNTNINININTNDGNPLEPSTVMTYHYSYDAPDKKQKKSLFKNIKRNKKEKQTIQVKTAPDTSQTNAYKIQPNTGQDTFVDEGTTVLVGEKTVNHTPVLKRCVNGESVFIDQLAFRIGKDRENVNYYVSGNSAISRIHAEIITRGNRYFVVDLGSKNRSFINGRILPIKYEIEIVSGDVLTLADEEFEFIVP